MISRRLIIAAAFLLAFISAGFMAAQALSPGDDRLSAPRAHDMARRGEIVILDVRRPAEWRETGMPAAALGVSIHGPTGREGFIAAATAVVGGDLTRPVATICATGVRSTRARDWLIEAGFTRVYNIKEGMFGRQDETGVQPGWLNRSLPVVRPTG